MIYRCFDVTALLYNSLRLRLFSVLPIVAILLEDFEGISVSSRFVCDINARPVILLGIESADPRLFIDFRVAIFLLLTYGLLLGGEDPLARVDARAVRIGRRRCLLLTDNHWNGH